MSKRVRWPRRTRRVARRVLVARAAWRMSIIAIGLGDARQAFTWIDRAMDGWLGHGFEDYRARVIAPAERSMSRR